MPFPIQAMTAGADGVEDSASVRRHGLERQGLAGFGQGLRTGGDGQETLGEGLHGRILGGEYLTSADARKGAGGQTLGLHGGQDTLHMEGNAQQGTQDGIPPSRRVSRPSREQGNRYLVLGIGDHGLERRGGEVWLRIIQSQRQQGLSRTLPRQTCHKFHGDAPRFGRLGLICRDLRRGIEQRLERSRQACRLTGRKISRQQCEPKGLRRRCGDLEFGWLRQRTSEVTEDLRHTRTDLSGCRPDRQEHLQESLFTSSDAAENAITHPLVLRVRPSGLGEVLGSCRGVIVSGPDDLG